MAEHVPPDVAQLVGANVPAPLLENVTTPGRVSVTMHVVDWPTTSDTGAHATERVANTCRVFRTDVENTARRMIMLVMITSLAFKR